MACDLRHFRETQDQVDLDVEFLQREHEKKENATRDFRETDRKSLLSTPLEIDTTSRRDPIVSRACSDLW
ncbi:unnamed protein product, partial [Mesorhabditis belari]